MQKHITVGADIELFVAGADGQIESSIGVLPGDKDNPHKTKYGWVHKDNVLAEFNIKPATSPGQFADNVFNVMADLSKILGNAGKTYAVIGSHLMDPKYLDNYEALSFGCNPDYNVWDLRTENIVNSGMAGNLRTAGGHVHIGFNQKVVPELQINVAKSCDLLLGIPSVILDKDVQRKSLYGKAGSFRPKPYGIEYRVLSNFWVADFDLAMWVFSQAKRATTYSHWGNNLSEKEALLVQDTINKNDVATAKTLCNDFGIDLP